MTKDSRTKFYQNCAEVDYYLNINESLPSTTDSEDKKDTKEDSFCVSMESMQDGD